jgi:hypothetical protein
METKREQQKSAEAPRIRPEGGGGGERAVTEKKKEEETRRIELNFAQLVH